MLWCRAFVGPRSYSRYPPRQISVRLERDTQVNSICCSPLDEKRHPKQFFEHVTSQGGGRAAPDDGHPIDVRLDHNVVKDRPRCHKRTVAAIDRDPWTALGQAKGEVCLSRMEILEAELNARDVVGRERSELQAEMAM